MSDEEQTPVVPTPPPEPPAPTPTPEPTPAPAPDSFGSELQARSDVEPAHFGQQAAAKGQLPPEVTKQIEKLLKGDE